MFDFVERRVGQRLRIPQGRPIGHYRMSTHVRAEERHIPLGLERFLTGLVPVTVDVYNGWTHPLHLQMWKVTSPCVLDATALIDRRLTEPTLIRLTWFLHPL